MKLLLASCCAAVLALANPAQAARPLPVPADTVAGQALLTKKLAAETCQQLTANPKHDLFASMAAAEAQQIFEQALSVVIEKRVGDIRQLARNSAKASVYDNLRVALPTAMALEMVRKCPAAATLFGRFEGEIATAPNPTAAENAFIESWGNELCQRLAALQAKGMFQAKDPAERLALFRREYTASLAARGPQIMQIYGPAGNSQQVSDSMGRDIASFMEQKCPQMLMLLKGVK